MSKIDLEYIIKTIETIKKSRLSLNDVMHQSVKAWYIDKNEEKLRIDNYSPLKDDIIIDAGAFDGVWIDKFLNKHTECKVICYEPSKIFFDKLVNTLSNHKNRVTLKNIGLSDSTYETSFNNKLGVASQEDLENGNEIVKLVNIVQEFEKLDKIYLLKMNIEGDEYKCIDSLIKNNLIHNIENIQIQFHSIGNKEVTIEKYLHLVKKLSKTHAPVYFYPFIWEGWKLK